MSDGKWTLGPSGPVRMTMDQFREQIKEAHYSRYRGFNFAGLDVTEEEMKEIVLFIRELRNKAQEPSKPKTHLDF